MNKKRLSVVMAGAMLASSVAPVLAATVKEYEVNGSNKGILIRDLRKLLVNNTFANEDINGSDANKSVYEIKISDSKGSTTIGNNLPTNVDTLERLLQNAENGTIVEITDKGHVEKNGKLYSVALEDIAASDKVYNTKKELEDEFLAWEAAPALYSAVYKMTYEDGILTVLTRAAASETTHLTLTYKVGDKNVDFKKAIDKFDAPTNDLASVAGFEVEKENDGVKKEEDIPSKVVAKVTISDVDAKYDAKLSDLYDGLLLTENGQKLLDSVKEYQINNTNINYSSELITEANGIYTLLITLENTRLGSKYQISIKSNNYNQIELFKGWMDNGKASVEVLAGDNRYETAVKVARENANIKTVAENGNIVLVNGNALVDGLAAAPLAASVINLDNNGNWWGDDYVAPILLTESNSIPKATKEYIKELIAEQRVGKLDKVTVYLVGGESVISPALERELKDLGLRVVRAGGKDREETSLEVAKLMTKDNGEYIENAFVVGADGEADAMSIASVAAAKRNPIIVESRKGISNDTIEYLKGYKTSDAIKATIIGGDTVVSKSTEDTLKSEDIKVDRISGLNRQATNAAIIEKFAKKGLNRVVVSKDGQNNKKDLVDALTATSLAVKHHAPIVLGTNKLSTAQINAIENKADRNGIYVYQVGIGVARDVLKTIAERVGLAK